MSESTRTAYIDGDWIIYAAGFASQKTIYCYLDMTERHLGEYKNITEIKKEVGEEYDEKAVFQRIELDPIEHCLHSAKRMLQGVTDKIHKRYPGCSINVCVDGDGNFRQRLATIVPYKGNRRAGDKPYYYPEIRDYLKNNYTSTVVHGMETDDYIATALTFRPESISVSLDKDLLQVPGMHLNPNKGWRLVDHDEGMQRLYAQCLSGDAVDNIKGCYKVGTKGAQKLMLACGDELTCWKVVLDQYKKSIEKYGGDIYNGLGPEQAAVENMRLVYLLRDGNPRNLWTPPVGE